MFLGYSEMHLLDLWKFNYFMQMEARTNSKILKANAAIVRKLFLAAGKLKCSSSERRRQTAFNNVFVVVVRFGDPVRNAWSWAANLKHPDSTTTLRLKAKKKNSKRSRSSTVAGTGCTLCNLLETFSNCTLGNNMQRAPKNVETSCWLLYSVLFANKWLCFYMIIDTSIHTFFSIFYFFIGCLGVLCDVCVWLYAFRILSC